MPARVTNLRFAQYALLANRTSWLTPQIRSNASPSARAISQTPGRPAPSIRGQPYRPKIRAELGLRIELDGKLRRWKGVPCYLKFRPSSDSRLLHYEA